MHGYNASSVPSKSGNSVHQMYVNHTSESLEDFMVYIADQLNNTDFILVDETGKEIPFPSLYQNQRTIVGKFFKNNHLI